jgi:transcriptional regulator with XRE-family HTH domain
MSHDNPRNARCMYRKAFGQLLKERREAEGITQLDLAERVKTSAGMIGHAETGFASAGFAVTIKLMDIFDINPAEITHCAARLIKAQA